MTSDACAISVPALSIRMAELDDIHAILVLHCEAFAAKFGGAFGVHGIARGAEALAVAWRRQGITSLQGMYVAEWQRQLVGTVMLRTCEMGVEQGSSTIQLAFQQMLGIWGTTRSIFALSLLNHPIGRHEGFITDVAVLEPFRRCGIATALLMHAEHKARLMNKHYLGLYVSSTNTGACKLYYNLGFRKVCVQRSWMTFLFFGQRSWFYMRKQCGM